MSLCLDSRIAKKTLLSTPPRKKESISLVPTADGCVASPRIGAASPSSSRLALGRSARCDMDTFSRELYLAVLYGVVSFSEEREASGFWSSSVLV